MPHHAAADGWSIGDLRGDSPAALRFERLLATGTAPRPDVEAVLGARVEELERRVDALEGRERPAGTAGCTLFLPTAEGYALAELDAPPPAVGTTLAVEDREYVVEALRRSPLPGDRRPCLVLTPA